MNGLAGSDRTQVEFQGSIPTLGLGRGLSLQHSCGHNDALGQLLRHDEDVKDGTVVVLQQLILKVSGSFLDEYTYMLLAVKFGINMCLPLLVRLPVVCNYSFSMSFYGEFDSTPDLSSSYRILVS